MFVTVVRCHSSQLISLDPSNVCIFRTPWFYISINLDFQFLEKLFQWSCLPPYLSHSVPWQVLGLAITNLCIPSIILNIPLISQPQNILTFLPTGSYTPFSNILQPMRTENLLVLLPFHCLYTNIFFLPNLKAWTAIRITLCVHSQVPWLSLHDT
jgi:hypothetical protein